MRIWIAAAALVVLAATPFGAAQGTLYKWVDEKGVTNYGDTPPQGARKAAALDESKSSLSVFPGLSKEELARLEARVEQARADRLERENAELRARAAPIPPPPTPRPYDADLAYAPVFVPLVVARRVPLHHQRVPVRGTPVQKTPPFPSMRLDR
jgi:transposase-like protein